MFAYRATFHVCNAFCPVVFIVDVLSVCCLVSLGRSISILAGLSALLCWAGVCRGRLLFLDMFSALSLFSGGTRLISAISSLMGDSLSFSRGRRPPRLKIRDVPRDSQGVMTSRCLLSFESAFLRLREYRTECEQRQSRGDQDLCPRIVYEFCLRLPL